MNFILYLEHFCENLGHDIEKARAAAICTWATPAKVERTIPLSALGKILEMINSRKEFGKEARLFSSFLPALKGGG